MAKVYINIESCKSCGICVENCPRNVFYITNCVNSKGYHYVSAVNEKDCIGCGLCERICPNSAIHIENTKRIVGIIGGMGPLATCDLYRKIVTMTAAQKDQDHLHVLIDGNTNIPDRTAAILNGGADPLCEMKKSAKRLIGMGATVLCMPCNTAHFFYERLLDEAQIDSSVTFVNMLKETAAFAKRKGYERVGLLATNGTVQSGVYDREFAAESIELIRPNETQQQAVMDIIYKGIKAGNAHLDTAPFRETMNSLMENGAQTLILGCTELPLAFEQYGFAAPNIDPTAVLASAVIREAGGTVKM